MKIKKECQQCKKEFLSYEREQRRFCSQSCAATFNNTGKVRNKNREFFNCLNCDASMVGKLIRSKYCSKNCELDHFHKLKHNSIENGEVYSSVIMKRYLIHKYGEKCMQCGWNEKHIMTGNVPIELEHIDGNSENNNLDNLKLLCPNCHSLTTTYKALNKGNGRYKRKERYKEGKSF